MLENILRIDLTELAPGSLFLCTAGSIALGLLIAAAHMYRNKYTKGFVITLALLPAIVQMVIMLVNGNVGTGVAVMGAFSLVRFRSTPGNAREIGSIFLAMAVGLSTGMGYIGIALVFVLLIAGAMVLLHMLPFGGNGQEKELKITIPENLDYGGIFDDIFRQYFTRCSLQRVKTTNMGSLFELQYRVVLKDEAQEKEMLDAIRCRNGNLTIICGRVPEGAVEL